MKKIMYLLIGLVVTALGVFLVVFWWDHFLVMLKGLLGPMIALAGAIVFIIGLMTPLNEEDLFPDDANLCDTSENDSKMEDYPVEKADKECSPCIENIEELNKTD